VLEQFHQSWREMTWGARTRAREPADTNRRPLAWLGRAGRLVGIATDEGRKEKATRRWPSGAG
jgi:hypothetical protein